MKVVDIWCGQDDGTGKRQEKWRAYSLVHQELCMVIDSRKNTIDSFYFSVPFSHPYLEALGRDVANRGLDVVWNPLDEV